MSLGHGVRPYDFDFSLQMTAPRAVEKLLETGIITQDNIVAIINASTDTKDAVSLTDKFQLKNISNDAHAAIRNLLHCQLLESSGINDDGSVTLTYGNIGLSGIISNEENLMCDLSRYYRTVSNKSFDTECAYILTSKAGNYIDKDGEPSGFSILNPNLLYPSLLEAKKGLIKLRENGKVGQTDGFIQRLFFRAYLSVE